MEYRKRPVALNGLINLRLHIDTNIKCALVWLWSYLLSNSKATLEAQFMKKLSNDEAELEKYVAYKKSA